MRAIICAGLYPNVAMIKKVKKIRPKQFNSTPELKYTVILQTQQEHHVELHPKSTNSKVDGQFKVSMDGVSHKNAIHKGKLTHFDIILSPFSLLVEI